MKISKKIAKEKRRKRIRKKISGTQKCPRLSIFRSAKHIYAQIIDDVRGNTIVSVSDLELKPQEAKITKKEKAKKVGNLIAEKAKKNKIYKVVFDRAGFKFHGRVKAVAEGAREGGLKF